MISLRQLIDILPIHLELHCSIVFNDHVVCDVYHGLCNADSISDTSLLDMNVIKFYPSSVGDCIILLTNC